jgi:hypothetical protein
MEYALVSEIPETHKAIRDLFKSQDAYNSARGMLMNAEGIGDPILMRYFGRGKEKDCPRSKPQIVAAIDALKQSGRYTKIIEEAAEAIRRDLELARHLEEERQKAKALDATPKRPSLR